MKNLYVRGMESDREELAQIKFICEEYGLYFDVFPIDYARLAFKSKSTILSVLNNRIKLYGDFGEKVNLICHSMGCNMGALMGAMNPSGVNKLVFISPEFVNTTSDEKLDVICEASKNNFYGKPVSPKKKAAYLERVRSGLLFLRTQKWASEDISILKQPSFIIHSKGDPFVSSNYIDNLTLRDNFESEALLSCNHNPLLEKESCEGVIEKVKTFLK